jgi:predicted O-linked N-acetylglucosamine transferase (SPINDLY family)
MYALYRKMNVMDCVASYYEEYVEIALKLGSEPAFRESVKTKILASNHLIFEDMEFVREMAVFMESAVKAARDRLDRTGSP